MASAPPLPATASLGSVSNLRPSRPSIFAHPPTHRPITTTAGKVLIGINIAGLDEKPWLSPLFPLCEQRAEPAQTKNTAAFLHPGGPDPSPLVTQMADLGCNNRHQVVFHPSPALWVAPMPMHIPYQFLLVIHISAAAVTLGASTGLLRNLRRTLAAGKQAFALAAEDAQ